MWDLRKISVIESYNAGPKSANSLAFNLAGKNLELIKTRTQLIKYYN